MPIDTSIAGRAWLRPFSGPHYPGRRASEPPQPPSSWRDTGRATADPVEFACPRGPVLGWSRWSIRISCLS